MGWNRQDWALFGRWMTLGAPIAIVVGAGIAIVNTPPVTTTSPPSTSNSTTSVIIIGPTRVETEFKEMPSHAAPERASTITPPPAAPSEPRHSLQSEEPTVTVTPVTPTPTTTVTPPTTTTVKPTPEVTTTTPEVTATETPAAFTLDETPVYNALVAEYVTRNPLDSTFLDAA